MSLRLFQSFPFFVDAVVVRVRKTISDRDRLQRTRIEAGNSLITDRSLVENEIDLFSDVDVGTDVDPDAHPDAYPDVESKSSLVDYA